MRILVFILSAFYLIAGCDSTDQPLHNIEGVYKGTYSITHNVGTDSIKKMQGAVTFEFTKTTYHYYGEEYLLPPAGAGKYTYTNSYISLVDTALHSDEFDPSLILHGNFAYYYNQKELKLTQSDLLHRRFHELNLTKQN